MSTVLRPEPEPEDNHPLWQRAMAVGVGIDKPDDITRVMASISPDDFATKDDYVLVVKAIAMLNQVVINRQAKRISNNLYQRVFS